MPIVSWLPLVGLLALSAIVAALLSRTRSPNAWLMAPLFIAAAVGNLGWIDGRMPDLLLIAAQVVIGSALGAQFRPEFLTRLFRLLWASCVVVLFAAGSMALFAAAIAWLMGYRVPTMVLAMAPAGIAEMVLTGKVLGLDSTHDRRLPADAHRHRADLVPHRAGPVPADRRWHLRQAVGRVEPLSETRHIPRGRCWVAHELDPTSCRP